MHQFYQTPAWVAFVWINAIAGVERCSRLQKAFPLNGARSRENPLSVEDARRILVNMQECNPIKMFVCRQPSYQTPLIRHSSRIFC
jgi:hypothetical protein